MPSFTSKMLREGLNEYEEDVVKWTANSLYGGSTDTVRNTDPFTSGIPHQSTMCLL